MNCTRIAGLVLRQYYLLRASPVRILPLFAWVAIDMIVWGYMSRYLNAVTSARFDFVPALLGAVLLWEFLIRVMFGVTTAFFEDVWSRNFLNVFATPLEISEYVAALVVSSICTSTIGMIVMLLLGTLVFGLPFFGLGVPVVAFLLVLFLTGIALGICGAAIVLWFGPAAEWLIWPIPAVLSPFAAVYYPLATLPKWMQYVAHVLPASYVFEGVRAIVAGHATPLASLAIAAGLALVMVAIAGWIFTRVYRTGVRTGLIARFSAESVT